MLKTLFANPVTRTFIALLISVLAVLGAFLTYVTAPESFGKTDIKFATDTIYYFADDWSLAYDYLAFSFYSGTLVIPAYHQGRVVAVLLIPPEEYPGVLSITLPEEFRGDLPEKVEDNLDQALIMLDYLDYKKIIQDSGDTILLRAEDLDEDDIPKQYLNRQLENGYNLLANYDIFGYTNWLLPSPQTVLLRLWGQRLGPFTYYEDTQVRVSGADIDIEFAHPKLETRYYPPVDYRGRVGVYMFFLVLAALGLIAFLSGGLDKEEQEVTGQDHFLFTLASLLGALLYSWALSLFQTYFQPPFWGMASLWLLPLILVAAWARQARLKPDFFGLSIRGLAAGVAAALSITAFFALGSTFALPAGIHWHSSYLVLALAILFREGLLRGFCQRVLSHWLHPLAGVLIVSCAWAAITVFSAYTGGGLILPVLSALGSSLLVGFLYLRTNNLLAAGLLAALLELAPLILAF